MMAISIPVSTPMGIAQTVEKKERDVREVLWHYYLKMQW